MPVLAHDGVGGKKKKTGHSHATNGGGARRKRMAGTALGGRPSSSSAGSSSAIPDFAPKRAKLGARKPDPGAAPPSFSTRKLTLGSQKVVSGAYAQWSEAQHEHDSGQAGFDPLAPALSRRKLSIAEITPQLKHYSASVRRGALQQLGEIVEGFPQTGVRAFGRLLRVTLPAMLDGDRDVRRECFRFVELLLDSVFHRMAGLSKSSAQVDNIDGSINPASSAVAEAFVPLFARHAATALTHMAGSVRIDAVAFVSAWVHRFPHAVATQAPTLVPFYVDLLTSTSGGAGASGASAVAASRGSRAASDLSAIPVMIARRSSTLIGDAGNQKGQTDASASVFVARIAVLSGLYSLLEAAGARKNSTDLDDTRELAFDDTRVTAILAAPRMIHRGLDSVLRPATASDGAQETVEPRALLTSLLPILTDLWLESTPNASEFAAILLMPKARRDTDKLQEQTERLDCCILICDILLLLMRLCSLTPDFISSIPLQEALRVCERHLLVFFPFHASNFDTRTGVSAVVATTQLCTLNSRLAELALNVLRWGVGSERITEDLESFVEASLLSVAHAYEKHETFIAVQFPQLADDNFFQVLLACFEGVLGLERSDEDALTSLKESFLAVEKSAPPGSSARIACVRTVALLLRTSTLSQAERRTWVLLLPKCLWQMRSTHKKSEEHRHAQYILDVLRQLACDAVTETVPENLLSTLDSAIIPFFQAVVGQGGKTVLGPFSTRWDPNLQRACLQCINYLGDWSAEMWSAVTKTLCMQRVSDDVVIEGINLTVDRAQLALSMDADAPIDLPLSFLFTLCLRRTVLADLNVVKSASIAVRSLCVAAQIDPIGVLSGMLPSVLSDDIKQFEAVLAAACTLLVVASAAVPEDSLCEHGELWSLLAGRICRWLIDSGSPLNTRSETSIAREPILQSLQSLPSEVLLIRAVADIRLALVRDPQSAHTISCVARSLADLSEELLDAGHFHNPEITQSVVELATLVKEYAGALEGLEHVEEIDALSMPFLPSSLERLKLVTEAIAD